MPVLKHLKLVLVAFSTFLLLLFVIKTPMASPATHVVISEAQIGGITATDEFVELYNPTENPVDITGWKLTKKISSGTESNLVASMSGTINPHSYFLITHQTGYAGGVAADSTYSSSSYSITTNNTVLLYSDNQTTLIDKVGMGTAIDFENTSAAVPANGSSIERINNEDTDNNSFDFILRQISNPQNSSFIEPTETPSPTPTPTINPTQTPTLAPSPTATSTPAPTTQPTETPTSFPTSTPTLAPSPTPTISPTPNPSNTPFGWLKSPVFTCSNPRVPNFVYTLLKLLMPYKFHCG